MHSSLVGREGNCWIVEAPDGNQYILPSVNIITEGVPAFVGMKGVMVSLARGQGMSRRFYARWTSGFPNAVAAILVPRIPVGRAA